MGLHIDSGSSSKESPDIGQWKESVQNEQVQRAGRGLWEEKAFTTDEIREIVETYERAPYGTKAMYLEELGVPRDKIYQWRKQVYHGNLDRNLNPRDARRITRHQTWEFLSLREKMHDLKGENHRMQETTDALRAGYEAQIRSLHAELDQVKAELAEKEEQVILHAQAVDALGKAIATLRNDSDA